LIQLINLRFPDLIFNDRIGEWGDGEMGRWGDGEMGRWGDGEMGRSDTDIYSAFDEFGDLVF
jgi:hypothetical protein